MEFKKVAPKRNICWDGKKSELMVLRFFAFLKLQINNQKKKNYKDTPMQQACFFFQPNIKIQQKNYLLHKKSTLCDLFVVLACFFFFYS